MMSPTNRELALLCYIHGYQLAHNGISPTFRECGKAIGTHSTSVVDRLLEELEALDLIRRLPKRKRAIEILQAPAIPTVAGTAIYSVPLPGGKA